MSGNVLATAVCCREWPVYTVFDGLEYGLKECGLCGEIPVLKSEGQAPTKEAVS